MTFALVHLSDIHIENEKDWILRKPEQIAGAIKGRLFSVDFDAIVIAVTGDIANRGLETQYKLAETFFEAIREILEEQYHVPVKYVVVPGNHDCDLSDRSTLQLRDISIEAINSSPDKYKDDDQVYVECLKVQQNFFAFAARLEPTGGYPTNPKVFYPIEVEIAGKKVLFNCFNSAWLTQKVEVQGRLLLPSAIASQVEKMIGGEDLAISLHHHPENWLAADNASEFRPVVRKISDIIMTGHEHKIRVLSEKDVIPGSEVYIQQAAALQTRDGRESSRFSITLVDLDAGQITLQEMNWNGKSYAPVGKSQSAAYHRNPSLLEGRFELRSEHGREVRSANDVPIAHKHRRDLQVEDLFVPPRLEVSSVEAIIEGRSGLELIPQEKFISFILSTGRVLLYADTLQGKTTIAKYLYLRLNELGKVPLFIGGENLVDPDPAKIELVLRHAFADQIEGSTFEDYSQLDKSRLAIIIDNFASGSALQVSLQKILKHLESRFEVVVAVAHRNLKIQQFLKNEEGEVYLSGYTHCDVEPMNRAERSQLIRKWILLGTTFDSDEAVTKAMRERKQAIEALVETGVLLPYPPYILALLQVSDSSVNDVDQIKYGTVGYLYESLITDKFESTAVGSLDLGQTYLLLGKAAHLAYQRETLEISEEEIDQILRGYMGEYDLPVHAPTFLDQVLSAGIFVRRRGRLEFVSPQVRDFFVAEALSQNLGDSGEAVREAALQEIDYIIRTLTYESHTRILLFLVFKAYDRPQFISKVLRVAEAIFSDMSPAQFGDDIKFLNELKKNINFVPLLEGGTQDERDGKRDKEYDAHCLANPLPNYADKSKFLVEYAPDLDHFLKTAMALKMIEVLGQLVRSFATTLKKEQRAEIVKECVDLGLRLLGSLYDLKDDDIDQLQKLLADLIKEKYKTWTSGKVLERANEVMLEVYYGLTFGVLRKIAVSTGLEDLQSTYRTVLGDAKAPLNYRIVAAAIRLENLNNPRAKEIVELGEELARNNPFMFTGLRHFVANYLNYSGVDNASERKLLSTKFGISSGGLANTDRTERARLPSRGRFRPPQDPENLRKPS